MNNNSIITLATDNNNNKIIVSTKETNDTNTYKGNIVLTQYASSHTDKYTLLHILLFIFQFLEWNKEMLSSKDESHRPSYFFCKKICVPCSQLEQNRIIKS